MPKPKWPGRSPKAKVKSEETSGSETRESEETSGSEARDEPAVEKTGPHDGQVVQKVEVTNPTSHPPRATGQTVPGTPVVPPEETPLTPLFQSTVVSQIPISQKNAPPKIITTTTTTRTTAVDGPPETDEGPVVKEEPAEPVSDYITLDNPVSKQSLPMEPTTKYITLENPASKTEQYPNEGKTARLNTPNIGSSVSQFENDLVQQRNVLLLLGAVFLFLLAYIIQEFDKVQKLQQRTAMDRLEASIKMFPKNPSEYNIRQTSKFAQQWWRRYNLRAIGITSGCILAALFLIVWHRKRRVDLHRRKTLLFWGWTVSAGFVALAWGLWMWKPQPPPKTLSKVIKQDPTKRTGVYLAAIVLIGIVLEIYRNSRCRGHRRHHHHHRKETTRDVAVL